MDMVFDPGNFGKLLPCRHIIVNQAEPAVQCQGNGHTGFGDRIHIRRNDGEMQVEAGSKARFVVSVFRQDFAVTGSQRHIVIGEGQAFATMKKTVGRLVEKTIPILGAMRFV